MTRLTEQMIIARSKVSDFSTIKKFHFWGRDITDVTLLQEMHGVETLVLSKNQIKSLKPFEKCLKLKEIYLRDNAIDDINELDFLKQLPDLECLNLEGNPCCYKLGANYRAAVLRTLPNLKTLDNLEVTKNEVEMALRLDDSTTNTLDEKDCEDAQVKHQQSLHQEHLMLDESMYCGNQLPNLSCGKIEKMNSAELQERANRTLQQQEVQFENKQQQASTIGIRLQHAQQSVRGNNPRPRNEEELSPRLQNFDENIKQHHMSLPPAQSELALNNCNNQINFTHGSGVALHVEPTYSHFKDSSVCGKRHKPTAAQLQMSQGTPPYAAAVCGYPVFNRKLTSITIPEDDKASERELELQENPSQSHIKKQQVASIGQISKDAQLSKQRAARGYNPSKEEEKLSPESHIRAHLEHPYFYPHSSNSQDFLTDRYENTFVLRTEPKSSPYRDHISSVHGKRKEPTPPQQQRLQRAEKNTTGAYRALDRRPTRSCSNVLSAALCIVNELDYDSLKTLEHAVRLQMENQSMEK